MPHLRTQFKRQLSDLEEIAIASLRLRHEHPIGAPPGRQSEGRPR